jgi:transposase-like protein
LKAQWVEEHASWQKRSLKSKRYVDVWIDGVYFNSRNEDDRQCLLVLIGVTDTGHKEWPGLAAGLSASELNWQALLLRLQDQGLHPAPELAIGAGALGFGKALSQLLPITQRQRCWVHKTANVLNALPKSQQPQAKSAWQAMYLAATKADANTAFNRFIKTDEAKYPKAVECLSQDRQALLAFYAFPAEHWIHSRTSNLLESILATVRLSTDHTQGCVSYTSLLSWVFQWVQSAQKRG